MPPKGTEDSKVIHIGFDDTDSIAGRCTTNLAFKIVSKLKNETGITFIDYPLLVRLNPNIPWKTRGNGAVCLRIKTNHSGQIIEFLLKCLKSFKPFRVKRFDNIWNMWVIFFHTKSMQWFC